MQVQYQTLHLVTHCEDMYQDISHTLGTWYKQQGLLVITSIKR